MEIETSEFKLRLNDARELFIGGKYKTCEPILNDLLLYNNKTPEIFQMLATIAYDKGKFNMAIKYFKRALEIDPSYIDASVGLSIIYNDLGRYEEGRKEFETAKKIFADKKNTQSLFTNEILAKKHEELGDLYSSYRRHEEALENFLKAKSLHYDAPVILKVADSYIKLDRARTAVLELRALIKHNPHVLAARQKLAEIYYDAGKIIDAIETWESILFRDPGNIQAKTCLKLAMNANPEYQGVLEDKF